MRPKSGNLRISWRFRAFLPWRGLCFLSGMTPQTTQNIGELDRQPMAEPTKYIVRCCEMRKQRQMKSAGAPNRQRIRVNMES
jgi:hypothetical protein